MNDHASIARSGLAPTGRGLRLELAEMSEGIDLKKLREIARAHIEKAAAGDMQAIKELRDTLDGKPVQQLEHDLPPDNATGITKIVCEIVHTWPSPEELHSIEDGITFEPSNGNERSSTGEPR